MSAMLDAFGGAIPSARLLPLLDEYERRNPIIGDQLLSRRIYKVRNEGKYVSLDFTDRLLIDMGMEHEWHLSLADLYETDAQITVRRKPGPRGFLTAEKVAAAYTVYGAGYSLGELSEMLWESCGYLNAETCWVALKRAFYRRGYKLRTRGEGRRLQRDRSYRCRCGVVSSGRTPGCRPCNQRAHWRKRHGQPYVSNSCKGCGCALDERTSGCGTCNSRVYWRRQRAHKPALAGDTAPLPGRVSSLTAGEGSTSSKRKKAA